VIPVLQYLKSRGFKDGIVRDLDLKFADAGFVNVDGMIIKIPVGNWGGKLGEVFIEDAIASYKSMQPIVQPILGYTDEQYQELIDNILRESNEVKEVGHFVMNWAQKPAN
jgi:hypothetical protein